MNTAAAVILSLMAGSLSADMRGADDSGKARDLVKQLGDNRFKVREAAEKGLLELGSASIEALKEGEKNPDIHIQDRCRILQPVIRELTLRKRLEDFIASTDGKVPLELPLAVTFLKATGDSKDARSLYADLLNQNSPLLELIVRDKKKGGDQFLVQCQEMAVRMQNFHLGGLGNKSVTRADVALYLLLSVEYRGDKTGRISGYGYSFMQAPILKETLAKDVPENLPLRKLFVSWMENQPQPHMVANALQIAADLKMKETVPLILKIAKDKTTQIHIRAQAALLLIKSGSKENLKDVEPLFEEKTLVGNVRGINNKQGQVQIRDIALAISIKLNGQKMSDYDFDVMIGNDDQVHTSYVYCAFSTNEKREAAHKKYKDWLAKEEKK